MIRWVVMIAAVTVVAALSICQPAVLAGNVFLNGFVTHEILSLLAVVLTITLASIANVHLTITRIIRSKFQDEEKGLLAAAPVRSEINSNAWALFWAFIACVAVLIVKGSSPPEEWFKSLLNGAAVVILLFNLLVLHDIYQTVFDLAQQGHGEKTDA